MNLKNSRFYLVGISITFAALSNAQADISGTVFRDNVTVNGVQNGAEVGVAGVTVTAYNSRPLS